MPFSSLISKTATPHVFLTAGGVYFVAFSLVRHFVPLLFAAQAPPLAFALDWDPAAVRGYTQADLAAAASTQFLASPAGQAALLTTAGLHVLSTISFAVASSILIFWFARSTAPALASLSVLPYALLLVHLAESPVFALGLLQNNTELLAFAAGVSPYRGVAGAAVSALAAVAGLAILRDWGVGIGRDGRQKIADPKKKKL